MREFHARILYGPEEAALLTQAHTLAAQALCLHPDSPCPPDADALCPHCRKVFAAIHPDLITLQAEAGKGLSIGAVRDLQTDVLLRPNEAERKVYILPQAGLMEGRTQNALLKLLEDGPAYAMFLLLTDNPKSLLETVRSRCQTLAVDGRRQPPAPEILAQAQTLLALLEGGDPLALLAGSLTLEKLKREQAIPLLEMLMELLAAGVKTEGEPYLAWYDEVSRMRQAQEFHIGAAHLAGWFATLTSGGAPSHTWQAL